MNKYELLKLLIAFLLGMIASQITGGKVEGMMAAAEMGRMMARDVASATTAPSRITKFSEVGTGDEVAGAERARISKCNRTTPPYDTAVYNGKTYASAAAAWSAWTKDCPEQVQDYLAGTRPGQGDEDAHKWCVKACNKYNEDQKS